MTSARDDIFANIRRSLHVTGQEAPRRASVEARLQATANGVIPARGQLEGEALIALFISQASAAFASVARVEQAKIPAEIARFLRENGLAPRLKCGQEPRLQALDWAVSGLDVSHGPSDGHDAVGLSHAFAGVAETGSLVLVSGPDNPTTLNFLPDTHIVVVARSQIHGDYEQALKRVRAQFGAGVMPRTVNIITGPSRSADIEQKLLLGAHGPRSLHIIIADDA